MYSIQLSRYTYTCQHTYTLMRTLYLMKLYHDREQLWSRHIGTDRRRAVGAVINRPPPGADVGDGDGDGEEDLVKL